MKKIIALCVASALSIAAHADEVSGTKELPIIEMNDYGESSQAKKERRDKMKVELSEKRAHLGELERLAVPFGAYVSASREDLLPYRFSDASKLQSMLRDPEWSYYWVKIAAAISIIADKKAALDLIEFIKSTDAPEGYEREWDEARASAIAALGYTLIDQDLPEVLEFLEKLDGNRFAESLKIDDSRSPQTQAYGALSIAATDDSVALLESLLDRKEAAIASQTVQPLSVGGQQNKDRKRDDHRIDMIKKSLNDAKRKRARIEPEPSKFMP